MNPEEMVRENLDFFHSMHFKAGHAGMFYACLNPEAPLLYNGPVYCAECMSVAARVLAIAA